MKFTILYFLTLYFFLPAYVNAFEDMSCVDKIKEIVSHSPALMNYRYIELSSQSEDTRMPEQAPFIRNPSLEVPFLSQEEIDAAHSGGDSVSDAAILSNNDVPSLKVSYSWEKLKEFNTIKSSSEKRQFSRDFAKVIALSYRKNIATERVNYTKILTYMGAKIPEGEFPTKNLKRLMKCLKSTVKGIRIAKRDNKTSQNYTPDRIPYHYFKTIEELPSSDAISQPKLSRDKRLRASCDILKNPAKKQKTHSFLSSFPEEESVPLSPSTFLETFDKEIPPIQKSLSELLIFPVVSTSSSSLDLNTAALASKQMEEIALNEEYSSSHEKKYTWEILKRLNTMPYSIERKEFNHDFAKAVATLYDENLSGTINYKELLEHMGVTIPEGESLLKNVGNLMSSLRAIVKNIRKAVE